MLAIPPKRAPLPFARPPTFPRLVWGVMAGFFSKPGEFQTSAAWVRCETLGAFTLAGSAPSRTLRSGLLGGLAGQARTKTQSECNVHAAFENTKYVAACFPSRSIHELLQRLFDKYVPTLPPRHTFPFHPSTTTFHLVVPPGASRHATPP